jgi:hypothetical protein
MSTEGTLGFSVHCSLVYGYEESDVGNLFTDTLPPAETTDGLTAVQVLE